jgi:hypothetical protein
VSKLSQLSDKSSTTGSSDDAELLKEELIGEYLKLERQRQLHLLMLTFVCIGAMNEWQRMHCIFHSYPSLIGLPEISRIIGQSPL